jgi:hypothetical protein
LWPENDGDLPAFMQQLTNTHMKRGKQHRHETGYGHLYQGRYKCFPVQTEDYFYHVVRYVVPNALRANLVEKAELWRWSSLGRERSKIEEAAFPILSAGASIAGAPRAMQTGLPEPPGAWGWNRPFAHAAAPESNISRSNYRRLPRFGGCHLFLPC